MIDFVVKAHQDTFVWLRRVEVCKSVVAVENVEIIYRIDSQSYPLHSLFITRRPEDDRKLGKEKKEKRAKGEVRGRRDRRARRASAETAR